MAYHKAEINYAGRTVDMLLLQFVSAPVADAIVHPDVSHEPRIATGIEKLVQRFALIFLTQLDTVRNCSTEGTRFMSLLGSGHIYDNSTLSAAAMEANRLTCSQIKNEDKQLNTADDEALESSEIKDLSLDRSTATVSVTIGITSVAGETYTYITPVKSGI